jgi:hypothetical protein
MIKSKLYGAVGGSAFLVLAVFGMIGFDGFRPEQTADAARWTFYVSNLGHGCEPTCCGGISLCCDVPADCDEEQT